MKELRVKKVRVCHVGRPCAEQAVNNRRRLHLLTSEKTFNLVPFHYQLASESAVCSRTSVE